MKKKNKPYFETFNNKSIKSIEDSPKLETEFKNKKENGMFEFFLSPILICLVMVTSLWAMFPFIKVLSIYADLNAQQREVNNIYYSAQEFKKENGQLPTLEELEYKSPFTKKYSNKYADAWGNNLIYHPEKYAGIRVICSAGKDGIENTEDDICVNPKDKMREDRQKENNDSLLFFLFMTGATSRR